MKSSHRIVSYLFFIAGLGIIISSFFLFLKDVQEEKLFYLNLVVSNLVYGVIFLRATDIFGTLGKVSESGSGFGLKWYAVWTYVPLAVILIVLSIIIEWPFKFCLVGHLILLFLLLLQFFLGSLAKSNVNESKEKVEARKSGLREINSRLALLEIACQTGKGVMFMDNVSDLKDSIRFVTASDDVLARSLEDRIISTITLITNQIECSSQSAEVIKTEFDECIHLIELRKKQY